MTPIKTDAGNGSVWRLSCHPRLPARRHPEACMASSLPHKRFKHPGQAPAEGEDCGTAAIAVNMNRRSC